MELAKCMYMCVHVLSKILIYFLVHVISDKVPSLQNCFLFDNVLSTC